MGNIMRQPAGVMARGFWLIELLPALHTEQDPRMAVESGGTLTFFEDISSLLVNVQWRQRKARWKREGKETERKADSQYIHLSNLSVTKFPDT